MLEYTVNKFEIQCWPIFMTPRPRQKVASLVGARAPVDLEHKLYCTSDLGAFISE